jgi:hypothetical protein
MAGMNWPTARNSSSPIPMVSAGLECQRRLLWQTRPAEHRRRRARHLRRRRHRRQRQRRSVPALRDRHQQRRHADLCTGVQHRHLRRDRSRLGDPTRQLRCAAPDGRNVVLVTVDGGGHVAVAVLRRPLAICEARVTAKCRQLAACCVQTPSLARDYYSYCATVGKM